ncbi:1,2-phenylacetyl-CoA epoxidase subunit PaaC [Acinetobacter sp. ANC 4640]
MTNLALSKFLLHIGDSQLVLAQRLAQWCGHAPELEVDIALANIGLDLLGQARNFLTLAGQQQNPPQDEDQLAYFRTEREFFNLLLCEQPNGDFAQTIVRQWFIDHYHVLLMSTLTQAQHAEVAALATKSLKEIKYHLRFSTGWMERLSLSTEDAHQRMQQALNQLWRFSAELFELTAEEQTLVDTGVIPDIAQNKAVWDESVAAELQRFGLQAPETAYRRGAKQGLHTEHLGYLLAEMQSIQRAYPNMVW